MKDDQKITEEDSSIELLVDDEVLIKMEEGKFFWKGQEVKDAHRVYERFTEWLDATKKKEKS